MMNLLLHIDPILRGEKIGLSGQQSKRLLAERIALILLCVMLYGGVMGSWGLFTSVTGDQWLSSLYSALKVPLLLVATFLLSLPVLFISYTLAGLRSDFTEVLHNLMEMQSGLAIILGSLAPFTLLLYASVDNYETGVLFNALMFGLATVVASMLMRRHYHVLVGRDSRHRHLLRFWILLYAFVGIQMGWVLRPFIGSPGSPVVFLRWNDLDNAYVTVAEMVWSLIGR